MARPLLTLSFCFSFALGLLCPSPAAPAAGAEEAKPPQRKLDRSGKAKKGKASYYARRFAGRTMANGEPMNPQSNAAASRTLPLGTKALVTNLENGRSAEVEIKDRGPYVAGRTVDLTPKTADELGMKERGVVPVEVAPIEVPQPDGSVQAGDGAAHIASSR
jgi:rare lipoprotein A